MSAPVCICDGSGYKFLPPDPAESFPKTIRAKVCPVHARAISEEDKADGWAWYRWLAAPGEGERRG